VADGLVMTGVPPARKKYPMENPWACEKAMVGELGVENGKGKM